MKFGVELFICGKPNYAFAISYSKYEARKKLKSFRKNSKKC